MLNLRGVKKTDFVKNYLKYLESRESKQPQGCISPRQTQFQCLAVKLYICGVGFTNEHLSLQKSSWLPY